MAGNKQRRFTDDFKREAVRLVENGRRGIERTARDLGISKSSLTRWMSDIREKDLLSGRTRLALQLAITLRGRMRDSKIHRRLL
jgi:transposase-like protein